MIRPWLLFVLLAAACVDSDPVDDPGSGPVGGKADDGQATPRIEADAVTKVFGIATFEVASEASGFNVVGRDASGRQVAHAVIYDTRNEIDVRNLDGRMASFTATSDASGDRSVYRINTLTLTIRRDAGSGVQTYEIHDDGGATEDVSFEDSDASTLEMQTDQLAMDPEVNALFGEPVAVLLNRVMLDTNLAAELARRRMMAAGISPHAEGGFCAGSLPPDVQVSLEGNTGLYCGAFAVMTALAIPSIKAVLSVGEVGSAVILGAVDAGLGLACISGATNRSVYESLKLLPCAVAYLAGAR